MRGRYVIDSPQMDAFVAEEGERPANVLLLGNDASGIKDRVIIASLVDSVALSAIMGSRISLLFCVPTSE